MPSNRLQSSRSTMATAQSQAFQGEGHRSSAQAPAAAKAMLTTEIAFGDTPLFTSAAANFRISVLLRAAIGRRLATAGSASDMKARDGGVGSGIAAAYGDVKPVPRSGRVGERDSAGDQSVEVVAREVELR